MKLSDTRGARDRFGWKAGDIARQLNFAGLAIVWLSAIQAGPGAELAPSLARATGLIVLSLCLDLLQHLYGSVAWGTYHRFKKASGVGETEEFDAPAKINWPTIALFWLKQLPVVLAYALLLRHLSS